MTRLEPPTPNKFELTTKVNNESAPSTSTVGKSRRPAKKISVALVFMLTITAILVNEPVSAMTVETDPPLSDRDDAQRVPTSSPSLPWRRSTSPDDDERRHNVPAGTHDLEGIVDRSLVEVDRIRHHSHRRYRHPPGTQRRRRRRSREPATQLTDTTMSHCFPAAVHQSPPHFQSEQHFASAIRNASSLRDVYRALYVDGYSLPDDVITCIIESQLGPCAANQSHLTAQNRRELHHDGASPKSVGSKKRCRRSENENQHEEVLKHLKYLREMNDCAMCVPRPVIERIGDRPADTIYMPDYTVVYRCPSHEMVCQAEGWQCVVAESEKIRRAFFRVKMPEIANSTEWKLFTQHTKCVCVASQRLPFTTSEASSSCSFLSCPSPFNLNITGPGRPCRCEKKNRSCENIASGKRALGRDQLRCINEGICHSDLCNKSLRLNKTTGLCEKSTSKRRHDTAAAAART